MARQNCDLGHSRLHQNVGARGKTISCYRVLGSIGRGQKFMAISQKLLQILMTVALLAMVAAAWFDHEVRACPHTAIDQRG